MPVDFQADVRAIDEIRRRLEAENAGEIEYFADLFADDAVMMVPDFPIQNECSTCRSRTSPRSIAPITGRSNTER